MPTNERTHRYLAVRLTLGLLAGLIVLAGVGFATGLVKVYDAPMNAGVVVGTDHSNFGYEWRGAPGFFVDND